MTKMSWSEWLDLTSGDYRNSQWSHSHHYSTWSHQQHQTCKETKIRQTRNQWNITSKIITSDTPCFSLHLFWEINITIHHAIKAVGFLTQVRRLSDPLDIPGGTMDCYGTVLHIPNKETRTKNWLARYWRKPPSFFYDQLEVSYWLTNVQCTYLIAWAKYTSVPRSTLLLLLWSILS